jgi:hypothetical protein
MFKVKIAGITFTRYFNLEIKRVYFDVPAISLHYFDESEKADEKEEPYVHTTNSAETGYPIKVRASKRDVRVRVALKINDIPAGSERASFVKNHPYRHPTFALSLEQLQKHFSVVAETLDTAVSSMAWTAAALDETGPVLGTLSFKLSPKQERSGFDTVPTLQHRVRVSFLDRGLPMNDSISNGAIIPVNLALTEIVPTFKQLMQDAGEKHTRVLLETNDLLYRLIPGALDKWGIKTLPALKVEFVSGTYNPKSTMPQNPQIQGALDDVAARFDEFFDYSGLAPVWDAAAAGYRTRGCVRSKQAYRDLVSRLARDSVPMTDVFDKAAYNDRHVVKGNFKICPAEGSRAFEPYALQDRLFGLNYVGYSNYRVLYNGESVTPVRKGNLQVTPVRKGNLQVKSGEALKITVEFDVWHLFSDLGLSPDAIEATNATVTLVHKLDSDARKRAVAALTRLRCVTSTSKHKDYNHDNVAFTRVPSVSAAEETGSLLHTVSFALDVSNVLGLTDKAESVSMTFYVGYDDQPTLGEFDVTFWWEGFDISSVTVFEADAARVGSREFKLLDDVKFTNAYKDVQAVVRDDAVDLHPNNEVVELLRGIGGITVSYDPNAKTLEMLSQYAPIPSAAEQTALLNQVGVPLTLTYGFTAKSAVVTGMGITAQEKKLKITQKLELSYCELCTESHTINKRRDRMLSDIEPLPAKGPLELEVGDVVVVEMPIRSLVKRDSPSFKSLFDCETLRSKMRHAFSNTSIQPSWLGTPTFEVSVDRLTGLSGLSGDHAAVLIVEVPVIKDLPLDNDTNGGVAAVEVKEIELYVSDQPRFTKTTTKKLINITAKPVPFDPASMRTLTPSDVVVKFAGTYAAQDDIVVTGHAVIKRAQVTYKVSGAGDYGEGKDNDPRLLRTTLDFESVKNGEPCDPYVKTVTIRPGVAWMTPKSRGACMSALIQENRTEKRQRWKIDGGKKVFAHPLYEVFPRRTMYVANEEVRLNYTLQVLAVGESTDREANNAFGMVTVRANMVDYQNHTAYISLGSVTGNVTSVLASREEKCYRKWDTSGHYAFSAAEYASGPTETVKVSVFIDVVSVDSEGTRAIPDWAKTAEYYEAQWCVLTADLVRAIEGELSALYSDDDPTTANEASHELIWAADSSATRSLFYDNQSLDIDDEPVKLLRSNETTATLRIEANISEVQKCINATNATGEYYLFYRVFNELEPLVSFGSIALTKQAGAQAGAGDGASGDGS